MKKILSISLLLISVVCIVFAFGGCGEERQKDVGDGAKGRFYTLKESYDNGWLDEDDVKSIACCYYDSYKYEENPYSGLYGEPKEGLSERTENELKQAYLEQKVRKPELSINGVYIKKYFGVYNGNYVISITSEYLKIDPIIEEEFYIGNVLFKNFWQGDILVYHIN